jgi:hypothetical protein
VGSVRLYHPDQTVAVAKRIVHHRKIARLKDIERHLPAWQQERAGQREYRNDFGKIAGSAVFGISRHFAVPLLLANYRSGARRAGDRFRNRP